MRVYLRRVAGMLSPCCSESVINNSGLSRTWAARRRASAVVKVSSLEDDLERWLASEMLATVMFLFSEPTLDTHTHTHTQTFDMQQTITDWGFHI